jgi:hypothetical protein
MSDVQRADNGQWKPGISGNQNGRPPGRGNLFQETFKRDLAESWAEHGARVLNTVATGEPAKFLAVCASLTPKDVQVSLTTRLPGNLQPDEWALVFEMVEAARQTIPDFDARQPGEVLAITVDALRSHGAKLIASDISTEGRNE